MNRTGRRTTHIPPVTNGLVLMIDPRNEIPGSIVFGGSFSKIPNVAGGRDVIENTGGNRPTVGAINGLRAATFASASTQYLMDASSDVAPLASNNGVFSLVFVAYPTNLVSKAFFAFKNDSPNNYCGVAINAGGNLQFFRGAATVTINNIAGGAVTAAPHVISVTYNGTNVAAWVDGAASIASTAAAADIGVITGIVYGSSWYAAPSLPMDGSMGTVLVYNRVLQTQERQTSETYLKRLWKI